MGRNKGALAGWCSTARRLIAAHLRQRIVTAMLTTETPNTKKGADLIS